MAIEKKFNFEIECLYLKRTPQNSQECYNKLRCLKELDKRLNPHHNHLIAGMPSGRTDRILRMYWAFKKQGN